MTAKSLMGLTAAAAFGLWVGQAQAAVFTLDLTATPVAFATTSSGGVVTTGFDVELAVASPITVQVGDEIQLTLTFTSPVTLPGATDLDLASFYLTDDGFPAGDTATHFDASFLNGVMVVASASQGTTTSDGLGVQPVLFGPLGPLTFDSITADVFVDKIAGSTDPGRFGTLSRGDIDVEARSFGAVPEPASWALMLVGFGGLGGVLRAIRSKAFA
jgi:hypothetical protein